MNANLGISIFEYLDYREFLADWFRLKKSMNPRFSHRIFAQKAEIKSSGYLSEVTGGLRNLSKGKIPGFARAMGLEERERAFLERLVAFNDAKSGQVKQLLYEQVLKALPSRAQQVKLSQMEYFSKWYYVAVREALSVIPVSGDCEALAAALHPPITAAQARGALKLLERLSLIERDPGGVWRARHAELLGKRDEASAVLIRAYQGEMIGRARNALETVPQAHRDISTVTMSISPGGLGRIKGAIEDFRNRVREIVRSDAGEDRVVQLNIQVFPLTGFGHLPIPPTGEAHAPV
ncbi:MAG: TIGR02147 family protein [Fibrobacteria bacterium]